MPRGLNIAALSFLIAAATAGASDEALARALYFVQENRVSSDAGTPRADFAQIRDQISATTDPETKFGYVLFSVARHSDKLLTADQAMQLDALIEARQTASINWHDVRNIVRIHAVIAMWDYAQADEDVAKYRKNWQDWTDLRLAYMFEEFIAAERFQRAFWALLTADQKHNLRSGEWDQYLKKNTGHKRLFSADKQVRRMMGMPDQPEAFDQATKRQQRLWQPIHKRYRAASKFQRQCEFSMDLTDENFDTVAWDDYATAFHAFVTAECDAIRDILQVSYQLDSKALAKLDQNRDQLHTDMIEKFRATSSDFLRALGAIQAE